VLHTLSVVEGTIPRDAALPQIFDIERRNARSTKFSADAGSYVRHGNSESFREPASNQDLGGGVIELALPAVRI
jgi:hypothetical protein